MTDDELAHRLLALCDQPGSIYSQMLQVIGYVREHDRVHRPPEPGKPKRMPVQIWIDDGEIFALANDGRIYAGENKDAFEWEECLPDLPQD